MDSWECAQCREWAEFAQRNIEEARSLEADALLHERAGHFEDAARCRADAEGRRALARTRDEWIREHIDTDHTSTPSGSES